MQEESVLGPDGPQDGAPPCQGESELRCFVKLIFRSENIQHF